MEKIILVSQTPSDVGEVLTLYDKYNKDYDIDIYVRKYKFIFDFFQSLELNICNLELLKYPNNFTVKNPVDILNTRAYLNHIYRKYFNEIENCKIYFFTHFIDWYTSSFIARLSHSNDIFFVDHYDSDAHGKCQNSKFTLLNIYRLLVYKIIAGVWFKVVDTKVSKNVLEFPLDKFQIVTVAIDIRENVYRKYQIELDNNIKSKSILLLESDHAGNEKIKSYDHTLAKIIDVFIGSGYNLYVKPHPRLGYSKLIDNYNIEILKTGLPVEFIELNFFDYIFGVESTATAKLAQYKYSNCYSLIDIFDFNKAGMKESYKEYLRLQSKNQLKFAKDLTDLRKVIDDVKKAV